MTSAATLRQLADEKDASARLLLAQHDQRCKTYPHTRFTAPVVALWEGHFALQNLASELRAMADAIDPPPVTAPQAEQARASHPAPRAFQCAPTHH